jgi:Tfp pilus assembly protein PilF
MALLERGEVERGLRLLEEAWRQAPEAVERMHGLARALDLAGERTRAMELLERAHALAPTEPGTACDLALLLLEHEQDAQAEQIITPVLHAHPHHGRANLHMAMALAKTRPIRAREYAAKALQDSDPELQRQAEALHRTLTALVPG